MKNKKRIAVLSVLLALTFITGAAFAFAPGRLDLRGNVNLSQMADLYLRWTDPTVTPIGIASARTNAAGFPLEAQAILDTRPVHLPVTPTVVAATATPVGTFPAPGERQYQRIEWTPHFVQPGTITLTHTATNASILNNAQVALPTVTAFFAGLDGTGAPIDVTDALSDFGLTVTITGPAFTQATLAPGATTGDINIAINWDGTMPASVRPDGTWVSGQNDDYWPLFPGETWRISGGNQPTFAISFVIDLVYGLSTDALP